MEDFLNETIFLYVQPNSVSLPRLKIVAVIVW